LYRSAIVFSELAEVLDEQPVKTCKPVIADDTESTSFQDDKVGVFRVSTHYLEAVGRILQEG
jgi:hypothetical protein